MVLALANGVLQTKKLSGDLYGGSLQGQATVNASKTPRANISLTVKNANVSKIEKALSRGRASLDVNLATAGASVAEMVSHLTGKGSFVLEGLDVRGGGGGSALSGILDLVIGLNQLGGQLGGSRKGKGWPMSPARLLSIRGLREPRILNCYRVWATAKPKALSICRDGILMSTVRSI